MATKEVKIYPTPSNNLSENEPTVDLRWAIRFLQSQLNSIPERDRGSATLKWAGPPIKYTKPTNKKEDALDILQGTTTGLTQAQVDQVLALLS